MFIHIPLVIWWLVCVVGAVEWNKNMSGIPDDVTRIVNGDLVGSISQYPYQVYVTSPGNTFTCGGSILAAQWVITAAHCVAGGSSSTRNWEKWILDGFFVRAGTLDRLAGGQGRNVDKVYVNPYYLASNLDEGTDFALLYLDSPFDLNSDVQPIPIASSTPTAGTSGIITGWGYTQGYDALAGEANPNTGDVPRFLHAGTAMIQDQAVVEGWYALDAFTFVRCNFLGVTGRARNWNSLIATGSDTDPVTDSCQGDSGGPLVVADSSSPVGYSLVGVTSWGIGCATARSPAWYVQVSFWNAWIQSTINNPPGLCGGDMTCGPGAYCDGTTCQCLPGYWVGNLATDLNMYACRRFLNNGNSNNGFFYELVQTATPYHNTILGTSGHSMCAYALYLESADEARWVAEQIAATFDTTQLPTVSDGSGRTLVWTGGSFGSSWQFYLQQTWTYGSHDISAMSRRHRNLMDGGNATGEQDGLGYDPESIESKFTIQATISNWATGEPSSANPGSSCVALIVSGAEQGQFDSVDCSGSLYYIRKYSSTTPTMLGSQVTTSASTTTSTGTTSGSSTTTTGSTTGSRQADRPVLDESLTNWGLIFGIAGGVILLAALAGAASYYQYVYKPNKKAKAGGHKGKGVDDADDYLDMEVGTPEGAAPATTPASPQPEATGVPVDSTYVVEGTADPASTTPFNSRAHIENSGNTSI